MILWFYVGPHGAGCPGSISGSFWRTPRRRLHHLWATSVSVLVPTQCISPSWGRFLCSSLSPFSLILALGKAQSYLVLSSFAATLQAFLDINEILSLLSPGWTSQLSQPFLIGEILQLLYHLCGSLLESLQYVHISHELGSPKLGTAFQVWPNLTRTSRREGSLTSLSLLTILCLM